jgi:hypothetical protein
MILVEMTLLLCAAGAQGMLTLQATLFAILDLTQVHAARIYTPV